MMLIPDDGGSEKNVRSTGAQRDLRRLLLSVSVAGTAEHRLLLNNELNQSNIGFRVPVSDISQTELIKFGKKRRKRAASKDGEEFFDDGDFFEDDGFSDDVPLFDPTVEYYPEPFCDIVESRIIKILKHHKYCF